MTSTLGIHHIYLPTRCCMNKSTDKRKGVKPVFIFSFQKIFYGMILGHFNYCTYVQNIKFTIKNQSSLFVCIQNIPIVLQKQSYEINSDPNFKKKLYHWFNFYLLKKHGIIKNNYSSFLKYVLLISR